jgi:hypothetical protein
MSNEPNGWVAEIRPFRPPIRQLVTILSLKGGPDFGKKQVQFGLSIGLPGRDFLHERLQIPVFEQI